MVFVAIGEESSREPFRRDFLVHAPILRVTSNHCFPKNHRKLLLITNISHVRNHPLLDRPDRDLDRLHPHIRLRQTATDQPLEQSERRPDRKDGHPCFDSGYGIWLCLPWRLSTQGRSNLFHFRLLTPDVWRDDRPVDS